MLAGLSTPLVLSVHSVCELRLRHVDHSGWHTTIFPPYFVAGAIFGGFAMVLQCMIPARAVYKLENVVTIKHIDVMCKFILATGIAGRLRLHHGAVHRVVFRQPVRMADVQRPRVHRRLHVGLLGDDDVQPRSSRKCSGSSGAGQTPWFVLIIVTFVNVGMWYERFVIIVQSLHHDFLPGSWGQFHPTLGGLAPDDRRLRPVLHLHAAVHPVPADGGNCGSEGRAADGEPVPLPPRRRSGGRTHTAIGVPRGRELPPGRERRVPDRVITAGRVLRAAFATSRRSVKPAAEPVPPFIPLPGEPESRGGAVAEFANGSDLLEAAKKSYF